MKPFSLSTLNPLGQFKMSCQAYGGYLQLVCLLLF